MAGISKPVGVLSCRFLLGLSLAVQAGMVMPSAADDKEAGQSQRTNGQMQKTQTIQGNVKQVKGSNYVIEGLDGNRQMAPLCACRTNHDDTGWMATTTKSYCCR